MSRFSSTVIREKIRRPSGLCAIPSPTTSWPWARLMSLPSKVIDPDLACISPEIVRSVVDLPAPLEPISVTIDPSGTFIVRPFTAAMLP